MSTIEKVVMTKPQRERVIAELKARGHHHMAALYEGLSRGAEFILVPRDKAPITIPPRPTRRGLIVVIGDDYETAEGPTAFHLRSLRGLVGKASAWAVMAGAPLVTAYEAATVIAGTGATVVIIETQPSEEQSWMNFLARHGRKTAAKLLCSPSVKEAA